MSGEAHKLKTLQTQRRRLLEQLGKYGNKVACKHQLSRCNRLQEQVDQLTRQIKRLQSGAELPIVSEHAMLRYLERVEGVDLESLRQKIITTEVLQHVQALGTSGKFPSGKGWRVVMTNNTVTTIEV